MPTLRPFRDYNEKDVINLFTFSGAVSTTGPFISQGVPKGTLVKIVGDGFRLDQEPVEMLGSYGSFSVSNFVSQRYGTVSKVAIAQAADKPLGLTLFDIREVDENGELLKFRPSKAAEMEAVLSGQTVPIVTKGIFAYSGVVTGSGQAVVAGNAVYAGANGVPCTTGTNQIGIFLGITGASTNLIDNSSIAVIKFSF